MDLGAPVPAPAAHCWLRAARRVAAALTVFGLVCFLALPQRSPSPALRTPSSRLVEAGSAWPRVEQAPKILGPWEWKRPSAGHELHELLLVVRARNQEELERRVLDLADPDSPNYGQWMTSAEVRELTRNDESLAEVHRALQSLDGVEIVRESWNGEFLRVQAPVRTWERFFATELHDFHNAEAQAGLERRRAANITIPDPLQEHLAAVVGLLELELRHPSREPVPLAETAVPGGTITPEKLRAAYNVPPFQPGKEAATSQAVFCSLNQHWSDSDLKIFQQVFKLPPTPVEELDTPLGGTPATMSDEICAATPMSCAEATLDVEYMNAMSPWSKMGIYNFPQNGRHGHLKTGLFVDFIEELAGMTDPPHVMSISYGSAEYAHSQSLIHSFNMVASKLAAMGTTLVASSGDNGANNVGGFVPTAYSCDDILDIFGLDVSWPASSPWVTGVGATMGVESGMPEIACATNAKGPTAEASARAPGITSGGGFSKKIKRPFWQPVIEGETMRGVPDISLAGHSYATIIGNHWYLLDGTSASAPVFAAMVSNGNAELNAEASAGTPPKEHQLPKWPQERCEMATGGKCWWTGKCDAGTCTKFGYFKARCMCPVGTCAENGQCVSTIVPGRKRSVGFLNPVMYRAAQMDGELIRDVTEGNNNCSRSGMACCGGYEARKGWDPVTGLGTVDFGKVMALIKATARWRT